jgi:hypothetical protein
VLPPAAAPTILQRLSQIATAFNATRQVDPKLLPLVLGVGLGLFALMLGLGFALGWPVVGGVLGLVLGLLGAMVVFGQRTTSAAISRMEGQPGAAAAVLQSMRGTWRLQPAVAFNRRQDLVHRVVGKPGVVLVGEGGAARVATMLKQEHRKVARIVGETPVHEVSVGNGEGQVPLSKLQAHLAKLPRTLKPADVESLDGRLKSLAAAEPPLPKGPMPRAPRGRRM